MRAIQMTNNIIAISDLRRKFGEIEAALPYVDNFVLTKKGVPFALLSATPLIKRKIMKKTAGAFKGTVLENDTIWKAIVTRKSRKEAITL